MANRSALLFAVALFGYPITGSVISLLQVDSRLLSIPFRLLVGCLSIWVIVSARHLKINRVRQVMIFIWLLYVLRLLYDWLVPHLQGADYALQYFIVSSILPASALMKAQVYGERRFAAMSFVIASAGALMGLLVALYGSGDDTGVDASGRLSLAALNPVSLGNEATSALLCGLVLWPGAKMRHRMVLSCVFALLLWCLVLTGSKGPMLQLLVCGGLWALRRGYAWRLSILALPLLVWLTLSTANPLATRLAESPDDPSTVDRIVMLTDSMQQIAGSPLIGSAFVELNSGYYPHNVFIESALALGVPMAFVFSGLMFVGAQRSWKSLKDDRDLLGLLFLQGLLQAATAGALFGAIQVWVILPMLFPAVSRTGKAPTELPRPDLAVDLVKPIAVTNINGSAANTGVTGG